MYLVFAGLRAYAISERNKWVLFAVLALGLINPAMQTVRHGQLLPYPISLLMGIIQDIVKLSYSTYLNEYHHYGDTSVSTSVEMVM